MTTASDQRSSISQAFLASIIESSDDAIVSKDLNGIIGTWNKGAERIFGYTAEEVIGKPITFLIPPELRDEETTILARLRRGESIEHYETVRRHKDGRALNISLTISPIVAADGSIVGASKIGRDITVRKRAEARLQQQTQRLEALNRLATTISSDLDLERIVQRVTDTATELTGAKFGAFFYNVSHRDRESYLLFTLSGAPREAFEKFGLPRATPVFADGTGIVRSDDIRADPRYGSNPPHRGMPEGNLPVVSYLAVPVVSRSGNVIGGLFFGHDRPGVFTQEAQEIAAAIAAHAAVAIDNARLFATAQQEIQSKELLLNEFKHRMKNTLATVQAIEDHGRPCRDYLAGKRWAAREDADAQGFRIRLDRADDSGPCQTGIPGKGRQVYAAFSPQAVTPRACANACLKVGSVSMVSERACVCRGRACARSSFPTKPHRMDTSSRSPRASSRIMLVKRMGVATTT